MLAARQLGRLLRIDAAAHGATAVPALAELIADSSTRVASAAVTSLASVARSSAELAMTVACTECVVALARHRSATVRLRACELAARIAEASPQAAAGVARAGLLDGLLAELELSAPPCRDLLAALAALESLSQLVESPVLATGLGASALGVLPRLAALATATDGHELVLRARALVVCCRVAGALASHRREVPPYVLPAAASILTDTSVPRELLSAAMDGLAVLSESANGADMVALTPGALESLVACAAAGGSSALGSEPSHAAAHTLATIAGAERAAEAALLSPPAEVRNAATCLWQQCPTLGLTPPSVQAALQAAFQRGLAQLSASPTLGEVLWAALRRRGDAFVSDRVAAYRLTSALGRRGWAANDVCAHAQLLGALLDARGESGHRACTWRHAAVCALAGAFRDADAMQDGEAAAMQRRLAAAASGGPFGTARREAAAPQVALQQL